MVSVKDETHDVLSWHFWQLSSKDVLRGDQTHTAKRLSVIGQTGERKKTVSLFQS